MASTYSTNLRLELIGTGEQQGTWGVTTNTNLGTLLEQAIGGYTSVTVTDGADTVLSVANGSSDQSRNATINLTGTLTAARNVICPAIQKLYVVKNATSGGYAITFKVSGQTGVSIANGSAAFVYVDGTDVRYINGTMGTIASQNSNSVSITGGSITGITDLAVADGGTGASTAANARTNLGAAAAGSNSDITSLSGLTTALSIAQGGTGANSAANARTSLGLGSIATQNANAVSITGGSVTGITDLAVADGGTGASSFTEYSVIVGGTTATGALQSVASVGSSGQVLTSNGAGALPSFQTISVSSTGRLLRAPQILTSGTSYTTPAGCSNIYVECVGGGGASAGVSGYGSAGGGGGGSGAYCAKFFAVSASTAYAYSIGSGGTSSGNGGSTTFTVGATTITAGGGSGTSGFSGGAGGTASNGDINISGNGGGSGSSEVKIAGVGGGSFFGGGARAIGSTGASVSGVSGTSGGGASGGVSGGATVGGASGGNGVIRIWEYA